MMGGVTKSRKHDKQGQKNQGKKHGREHGNLQCSWFVPTLRQPKGQAEKAAGFP